LTRFLQPQAARHHSDYRRNAWTIHRFRVANRNKNTQRAAEGRRFFARHFNEDKLNPPLSTRDLAAGIIEAHSPKAWG